MMLSEEEIKCVHTLAKWYEGGKKHVGREEAMEELGVNNTKFDVLMRTMKDLGAIDKVSDSDQCEAIIIWPSPRAIQLARDADVQKQRAEAPPDIVEQLKKRVRQNPWTAWPIIIFFIFMLLISMLNNLLGLMRKILDMF